MKFKFVLLPNAPLDTVTTLISAGAPKLREIMPYFVNIMIASHEDILSEFRVFGIDIKKDDVVLKISELSQQYGLNAESFAETWLAFATNNQLGSQPTIDYLSKLEIEELNKKKIHKNSMGVKKDSYIYETTSMSDLVDVEDLWKTYGTPEIQMVKKRQRTPDCFANKKFNLANETPSSSPIVSSPFSVLNLTPSAKYASRTNMGHVVCEFGSVTGEINWQNIYLRKSSLTPYQENSVTSECYKYMFEKLQYTAKHLNFNIENMEEMFKENYAIEEFLHIRVPSTETIEVVGRICCDGNGKLNASSILLEGSYRTSAGMVTEVDVSRLPSYSLFPGKIVALSGTNPTGQKFVAQNLHNDIYPSLPTTQLAFSDTDGPLQMIVAAGPYMTADSLSYEPLEDFLKVVQSNQPHACILIGPFVDAKHQEIGTGNFPQTYEDIFSECMNLIQTCAKMISSTQFIVVASSRDIHHNCIYPTPPFALPVQLKNYHNIHFVSDPSILNLDGVIVALTATDILLHLGKEEISFPPSMPDRLGRLASHLLSQQSFYPLYPPSEDMQINFDKLQLGARLGVTPHILILPSDLNYFIKSAKGCCCINPQRLTKGESGGTFARLQTSRMPTEQHSSLINNIVCQVVRI